MKIIVVSALLIILIHSQSVSCPLAQASQSRCYSGQINASPNNNYRSAQDLSYSNTYPTPLNKIPQVSLSLCGYQDQNNGAIQVQVSQNQVSTQGFNVRVQSPANNIWTSIVIGYLCSTKPQIQIGITSTNSPSYASNGFITLTYRPTLPLTSTVRVKAYVYGISINTKPGGLITFNNEQTSISGSVVNIVYSSNTCTISSLYLSVVLYDTATPGLAFLDGTISQGSLSSTTSIQIDPNSVQQLTIYFFGFLSMNTRSNSGLSVGVTFSTTFQIAISSTNLNSIQVNYIVISFVQCGSCTGYPYPYNGTCYQKCPSGSVLSQDVCVPVGCGNGYQKNQNGQCIPSCGTNRIFTGKTCSCNKKYYNINGTCSQCPSNTVYNYMSSRCDPPCGTFSRYSTKNKNCSCSRGFTKIGSSCNLCPTGTIFNNVTNTCNNISAACGTNQVYNGSFGCQCISGYNMISGSCQKCPGTSSFSTVTNTCVCPPGSQMNTIMQTCVPFGNPIYNGGSNQGGNNNNNNNNFNCGSYGYMDQSSRSCKCNNSYVWAVGGCKQPQNCASNSFWSGKGCTCNYGYSMKNNQCQSISQRPSCPLNSQFNGVNCECNQGYYPISKNGQCSQCPSNTYWNGQSCGALNSCKSGFSWDNSHRTCNYQNTGCLSTQYWDGANCRCNTGYNLVNGACTQCPAGTTFDGQQCSQISYNTKCNDPYSFYNGKSCVCIQNYYMMNNGACISCPLQYQWSGINCIPIGSSNFSGGASSMTSTNLQFSNTVSASFR